MKTKLFLAFAAGIISITGFNLAIFSSNNELSSLAEKAFYFGCISQARNGCTSEEAIKPQVSFCKKEARLYKENLRRFIGD